MSAVYDYFAQHFSSSRSFLGDDLKPFVSYARDGDQVLDIGCGNGRLNLLFEDLAVAYTGIDQSYELIKLAKEKFPQARFVVGDMRELPFPDEEFDVIFCIAAFHHLPDEPTRLQALAEMKRVLKKGSKIILMNWNLNSQWAEKKLKIGNWKLSASGGDFIVPWKDAKGKVMAERYYHAFIPEEIATLSQKAGLKLIEQYYVKKAERSDGMNGDNLVSILTAGD